MKKGLHHVALNSLDADKTALFYEKAFGFKKVRRWGDEKPAVMMDVGDGTLLEIFTVDEMGAESECRWPHIAVASADTDGDYKRAISLGAVSHMEPKDIEIPADNPLSARIAFVKGLNGELIEIFCEK